MAAPGLRRQVLPRSAAPVLSLLLLLLASTLPHDGHTDAPAKGASLQCSGVADQYLDKHHKEAVPYTGSNMVYFLHVPRTAGRTFHSCFLKMGTPPSRRCPKAYDHLRINVAVPNCYLLSSHDDFSVVSMLPENVSVLTQIRDPVDRVLSAYEFAVEVAARAVNRPTNFKRRANKMATEDVWPWSYLVPWFVQEIRSRVHEIELVKPPEAGHWINVRHNDGDKFFYNKVKKLSKWNITEEESALLLPPLNPYDNPMLPSLQYFLEHPMSHELVHNGASFQVLGITNYSHWGDAAEMRRCIAEDSHTGEALLQVAKNRIRRFLHVGTTDRLADSVASVAAALDYSLGGAAFSGGEDGQLPATPQHKRNAARAGRRAPPATNLNELAQLLRQTRGAVQVAQAELISLKEKGADEAALVAARQKVDDARAALVKHQDAMAAARNKEDKEDDVTAQVPKRALAQAGAGRAAGGAAAGGWTAETKAGSFAGVATVATGDAAATDAGVVSVGGAPPDLQIAATEGGVQATQRGGARQLLEGQGRSEATEKKLGGNLGQEYTNCASRAHGRNMQRKDGSLQLLAMPDGRDVKFTRESRAAIPAATIDYIRTHNWIDIALHQQALEQLEAARTLQRDQGTLMDLPPTPRTAPSVGGGGKEHPIPKPPREEKADEL